MAVITEKERKVHLILTASDQQWSLFWDYWDDIMGSHTKNVQSCNSEQIFAVQILHAHVISSQMVVRFWDYNHRATCTDSYVIKMCQNWKIDGHTISKHDVNYHHTILQETQLSLTNHAMHLEILTFEKYRDLETRVRGHWRSMEMSPFNTVHGTSYWCSIVTMALSSVVSEIFNVEKCRDLEIRVPGHSRSLKVVPFDKWPIVSY